jgi:protein gp37
MQETKIEWTDLTVNPFRARDGEGHVGHYCEKISPGCKNCYASKMQRRFRMPEFQESRRREDIEVFLDESKLLGLLKRRKPAMIFPFDMTDLFGHWVPDEWLDKFFAVAALTPHITYQVLTKRAGRMRDYFAAGVLLRQVTRIFDRWLPEIEGTEGYDLIVAKLLAGTPNGGVCPYSTLALPNVWLGVSCENQATADERIPLLLQTPAAVRWVSAEPLLGPIDFGMRNLDHNFSLNLLTGEVDADSAPHHYGRLDQIIVGGESGSKARDFDIHWARDIRDQCAASGAAFFMKQMGSNAITELDDVIIRENNFTGKGGDMAEWPEDLRIRQFPK